jgi:hypothetical protein
MKIYLSAAFSRQAEMRRIAEKLGQNGHTIISAWLGQPPEDLFDDENKEMFLERALADLRDIDRSDVLVRFTDDLSEPTIPSYMAMGGRMFETGYAYKKGLSIVVVGGKQNIFDMLPTIFHVESVGELINFLELLNKGAKQ